jgi:hypothetical protein
MGRRREAAARIWRKRWGPGFGIQCLVSGVWPRIRGTVRQEQVEGLASLFNDRRAGSFGQTMEQLSTKCTSPKYGRKT